MKRLEWDFLKVSRHHRQVPWIQAKQQVLKLVETAEDGMAMRSTVYNINMNHYYKAKTEK